MGGQSITDKIGIMSTALRETGRVGIDDLLEFMEQAGFWTAPASGGNHCHCECGLMLHSYNVWRNAHSIGTALLTHHQYEALADSLTIVSILHDLGKVGDFGKPLYVPNYIKNKKYKKSDPDAEPEFILSEAKPYQHNTDLTNIPHSFRSVKLAEKYINLTEEEEYAILYHDGLYERTTGGMAVIPGHETPLLMILHWADMWATKINEKEQIPGNY